MYVVAVQMWDRALALTLKEVNMTGFMSVGVSFLVAVGLVAR